LFLLLELEQACSGLNLLQGNVEKLELVQNHTYAERRFAWCQTEVPQSQYLVGAFGAAARPDEAFRSNFAARGDEQLPFAGEGASGSVPFGISQYFARVGLLHFPKFLATLASAIMLFDGIAFTTTVEALGGPLRFFFREERTPIELEVGPANMVVILRSEDT
jgi:hypothetical protein